MSYTLDMTGCEVYTAICNIIQSGPRTILERIGEEDGFRELRQIVTNTAVSQEEINIQISNNVNLGLPKFSEHKEFQNLKNRNNTIAIVGGGPSLEDNLEELRKYEVILAAGSSHDYLVKNGIYPTYCAVCDPDKLVINYLKEDSPITEYFVASSCHPDVFDHLLYDNVYIWHCFSDGTIKWFNENLPGEVLIGGGCTIGLRSINISILMGYKNIHLFGFDSCMRLNNHHAYTMVNEKEELKGIGEIYNIKIGKDGKKTYQVAGYQLAQADHFRLFLEKHSYLVKFTFHGDGLLKDVYEDFLERNSGVYLNG